MLWTMLLTGNLLAADWYDPDFDDWLTPRVLEREALFDIEDLTRRTVASYRGTIDATLGEDACLPTESRTPVPIPIHPTKDEVGDWVGTRLTPTSYPFRVHEVSYYLGEEDLFIAEVKADIPHRFVLHVSSSNTPPDLDTVDPIAELSVQLTDTSEGYNLVLVDLEEPITLHTGESLYVSVELPGDWPEVMSVLTCEAEEEPGGWWWSNDNASWKHLETYNLTGTPMIQAAGYILF